MKRKGLTAGVRSRLRCLRRTGGLHELDLGKNRCRYCKRDWTALYAPNNRTPPRGRSPGQPLSLATAAFLLVCKALGVKR